MYNIDYKKLSDTLINENVLLKTQLKEYKEMVDDYKEKLYTLNLKMNTDQSNHQKKYDNCNLRLKRFNPAKKSKKLMNISNGKKM